MTRLRVVLALILAALWLPATQHCGLEAAGLLVEQCLTEAGDSGCTTQADCANDNCGLLEGSSYRSDLSPVKVGSPQLTALATCAELHLLSRLLPVPAPEPASILAAGDPFERPRAWIPSWQFERRAAAPAHAPDTLIA